MEVRDLFQDAQILYGDGDRVPNLKSFYLATLEKRVEPVTLWPRRPASKV